MKSTTTTKTEHAETLAAMHKALRMVCMSLPHLSEFLGVVQLHVDRRVETAGIFPSGRLLVNPDFAASLNLNELTFVMAHELMHLALKTHVRGTGSDPLLVNYAHDFIINDMLVHDLGCPVPAGGLHRPDARFESLEKLVKELKQTPPDQLPQNVWGASPGSGQGGTAPGGDVLSAELEREMFPDTDAEEQQRQTKRVLQAAEKATSANSMLNALASSEERGQPGQDAGGQDHSVNAAKMTYRPPWEQALQRWFDAVAPRTRTFARPSRRGALRQDVVLPGRKREGWTLHIVLDCSGSMYEDLTYALGVIATFCDATGVDQIHLVQCDVEVTKDEWVTPEELARYPITGLGGTDMTPALEHLADDPEVEAVLVLTDEDVLWAPLPEKPLPYDLLWVLMRPVPEFQPPQGKVIPLDLPV